MPQQFPDGDRVGGDKIVAGNIEQSVVAIGRGASVVYQNIERALTQVEIDEQTKVQEHKRLAEAVRNHVGRLHRQAEQTRSSTAVSPYKALLSYEFGDAPLFYGREQAIKTLLARITRGAFTVLYADSGAGKSSLLKAGIMPRLLAEGNVPVYLRPYQTPAPFAIKRALLPQLEQTPNLGAASLHDFLRYVTDLLGDGKLVLLIDQAEELFTVQSPPARQDFLDELAPCLVDDLLPVRWVISLRKEWFGDLSTFEPHVPNPFANEYFLQALTIEEARTVITEPARAFGVQFEPGLVERLVHDLDSAGIAPPQLQLVCSALFDNRQENVIPAVVYDDLGEVRGILRNHLDRVLNRNFPDEQRAAARLLLEALITADGHRVLRKRDELATELRLLGVEQSTLDMVLGILINSRLLRVEEVEAEEDVNIGYELAHDYLLEEIELDPATQARKAAQEMLDNQVVNYVKFGTLLDGDELAIVESQKDQINIDEDANKLLEASRRRLVSRRRLLASGAVAAVILMVFSAISVISALSARSAVETTVREAEDNLATVQAAEEDARQAADEAASLEAAAIESAAEAEAEAVSAQAQRLAYTAQSILLQGGDPIQAAQLALQSYEMTPTLEGYGALIRAAAAPYPFLIMEPADGQPVDKLALTSDATRIAVTTPSQMVFLVNIDTGETVAVLDEFEGAVIDMDFSHNDKLLLTAGQDGKALVWNALDGSLIHTLDGHTDMLTAAEFSPDDRLILTASADQTARLWDAATGESQTILDAHTDSVSDARFSPDGSQVLTTSKDTTARIWDVQTGQEITVLSEQDDALIGGMFNNAGDQVVVFEAGKFAHMYDVLPGEQGQLSLTVMGHSQFITGAMFTPSDGQLVTVSEDGTALIEPLGEQGGNLPFLGHDGPIRQMDISPDGKWIVTGSDEPSVIVWDSDTASPLFTLGGHINRISGVAFAEFGTRVVTGSVDGTVRFWRLNEEGAAVVFDSGEEHVSAARFIEDGERILTVNRDDTATVWDMGGGTVGSFEEDVSSFIDDSITFEQGEIYYDGRLILRLDDRIHFDSVAVNSDVSLMATGGPDGSVRIFSIDTGEIVASYQEHTGPVTAIAFSPDNNMVASGSTDENIVLWDLGSQTVITELTAHDAQIVDIQFSPSGSHLLTAGEDHAARLWLIDTDMLIELLTGRLRRLEVSVNTTTN